MSMTILAVVFAIALFSSLALLSHFTAKKVIEEPLKEARARRSLVAEFVDDLQNHRWTVIIVIALLVAVDKSFRFSGGMLQSRLMIGLVITVFFVGRLLLRQRAQQSQGTAVPNGMKPPEQDR
jgi:hypothetical protein